MLPWLGNATAIAVLLVLAGCAPNPVAVPAIPHSTDLSNAARLVVYRPSTQFFRFNPEAPFVYVNDNEVGKLRVGQALSVGLAPGHYEVTLRQPFLFAPTYVFVRIPVEMESQKTYYVRIHIQPGGRSFYGLVDEDTGLNRR